MSELFSSSRIEPYLKSLMGSSIRILSQSSLAKPGKRELKSYGYGTPLLIEYELEGARRKAVLHTIRPSPFGHEHMSDRAQSLLWDHSAFNSLPRHVRSLDVGAFRRDRTPVSLGDAEEFFTLTDYGEGVPYAGDLERIRDSGEFLPADVQRADALCDYLAAIHKTEGGNPDLYVRRIRELVGNSECIMGLIDNYPADAQPLYGQRLAAIEKRCIDWRWKLKGRVHRLRQVHGDFHPWNILFERGTEFCLLDRSRGEWGDAADDVTCLTMNYVFFSLQRSGRLEGPFEKLFRQFWERYLQKSNDVEILEVAAPFLVFRGLVMAHPVWYPNLHQSVRDTLFRFMDATLSCDSFNPAEVNRYCGA
jgi:Phosphotransferase enzyme family